MIVGVSFDTVEEQKAFAESEQFPYTLLADPARKKGAANLIAPDGTIARAYDLNASTALDEHAADLLADITALN